MAKKGSGINLSKGSDFTAPTKESEKTDSSSLGLTLTASLGEYGDYEVKAVVEVDISPLNFDANYDTSSNELSVSGEIGLPGGVVGIGGGVMIDLDTGEVIGGSGSISFGGIDVEVSISKCETTIQTTYWGVGFAVSENTCEAEPEPEPEPDPALPPSVPGLPPEPDPNDFPAAPGFVLADSTTIMDWVLFLDDYNTFTGTQTLLYTYEKFYELPSNYYPGCTVTQKNITKKSSSGQGFWIDYHSHEPLETEWEFTIPFEDIRKGYLNIGRFTTHQIPGGFFRTIATAENATLRYTNNVKAYMQWQQNTGGMNYISIDDAYNDKRAVPILFGGYSTWILIYRDRYVGWFPLTLAYQDVASKQRRPIPPEDMSNNQCCDASVSMLRKIMRALAVESIVVENEKDRISTENIDNFKEAYNNLAQQLPEGQKPKVYFNNYLELKIFELATGDNAKIQDIAKVLGVEAGNPRFPFSMPSSFRNVDGNEPQNVDIDDYPEAFGYLLDRIDELVGQFEIEIEIEDTDPVTQGNQSQKIKIGNIAEGIAEIIGLIYGLGISSKIGSEAAVKSLITLGMMQRVMTEIDAVTEELLDHFEVPIKETTREIDLEFTPGAKNFEHFFKPSKENVKVVERLMDKKHPTVQDQMEILLQAAEIIKARGFRKVNPYADIAAQVVGGLASGLLDKHVLNNNESSEADSKFDDFIEDVQENFRDYEKPEEIDLEKSDNPKIVKLNKPTDPTPNP